MRQSSDTIHGSPTFHLKVAKQEDGTYTASCPAQKGVAAETRATEGEAIVAMRSKLERFVCNGGR
jgi:hypothetical protein